MPAGKINPDEQMRQWLSRFNSPSGKLSEILSDWSRDTGAPSGRFHSGARNVSLITSGLRGTILIGQTITTGPNKNAI